ncbi:MAG: TlpA disulfide reductase family protein [Candidatus Brocadiia bacterium]
MRKCRLAGGTACLVVGLLLCAGWAAGQEAPAETAMQTNLPEDAPTPTEIARQMVQTLEAAETFRMAGEMEINIERAEGPSVQTSPVEIAYASGMKLKLETAMSGFYANGETAISYMAPLKQYKEQKLTGGAYSLIARAMPRLEPFLTESDEASGEADWPGLYADLLGEAELVAHEQLGETDCWVVAGQVAMPRRDGEAVLPLKVWHRAEDGVVLKAHLDMTATVRPAGIELPPEMAAQLPESVTVTLSVDEVSVDEPLPEGTFTFQPPEGAEKVTQFGPQPELLGEAAPEFETETLAGDEVALADLRGKAVVLDFWASWCGPCRMALPHTQELWEDLGGEDVLVFGLNADRDLDAAKAMVEELGLTFPSLLDRDQSIVEAYGIRGIPTMVVIGPDGKVAGWHSGYDPNIVETVKQEIEGALAEPETAE